MSKDYEILQKLKADFNSCKNLQSKLDSQRQVWVREYNGEPYGNESELRSKIVSRDIKKQSEWQHAALIEPFVSTPDIIRANPITAEDAEAAPKIEVLLNTQFCRQFNRYNFMTKALKVMDQEGTVVIRTGWEYEEKEIEVKIDEEVINPEFVAAYQAIQAGQLDPSALQDIPQTVIQSRIEKQVKPVKNHPTAAVCRNEDVFIDPTCQDDMDKCQFIIYRYESDLATLTAANRYKNLDKIQIPEVSPGDEDYNSPDKSYFTFKDKARRKLLVYEYWGYYDINDDGVVEPIVCTWTDNTLLELIPNPFPDQKLPFIVTPFNSIPFSLYGEPNAELLSDVQKVKTAIYRGFIDNMALSSNGQKGVKKGALDPQNLNRFYAGENFEYNGVSNDIFYEGSFNELPGSIFNMLQMLNNEAESITGVASFNQGINGNSMGSNATAIRGVIDSSSTRRLNIVRNISENLIKPLLRKWLAYSAEFLDEEAQFRITNEEFIWLKRDDLGANIDIDLNISTSDDNQAKAQELAFLLQTLGPSEDPFIRKTLMVEIARLYRMPQLAKAIETYEPQPDPMQQRLMELQAQLLEAQIADLQAKAGENEVDKELKGAKVQTELAKAKNLSAQADKTDLDYIQQYYGTPHKQAMQAQEQQNQFEVTQNILKLLQNTQNKGRYV